MSRSSILWPLLGALGAAAVLCAIAWHFAGDDINASYHTRGAAKFVGMAGAIGLVGGWYLTSRLTRGATTSRTGLTLSYRRIEPTATGYRELTTVTVDDLLAGLRAVGYAPVAKACDDVGTVRGELDAKTPLAGANVAISDAGVKGWIRVQLAPPPPSGQQSWPTPADLPLANGSARAMGLIEIWTTRGESAGELALFSLRVLDGMVGDLKASYDDSVLSGDPANLFVAALADRPQHRR